MTVKAIFCECSLPLWVDVASKLGAESNWEPCYWTAIYYREKLVKDRFPHVVFHPNLHAVRGIPPEACADLKLPPLDRDLLEDLASHEAITLGMMNRMDPGHAFDYQERVRLYHSHLLYWLAVLDHFGPDVVVFSTPPHLVYDYVLYVLCQRKNVKTVMFELTAAEDLLLPIEKFEEGSPALRAMYRDLLSGDAWDDVPLSPKAEAHLRTLTGSYSEGMPFYMLDAFSKSRTPAGELPEYLSEAIVGRQNASASNGLDLKSPAQAAARRNKGFEVKRWLDPKWYALFVLRLIARPYAFFFKPHPRNYLKQRSKPIEESFMTGLQRRMYKARGERKKRRLGAHYANLAQDVDLDVPYVLVGLHYQPESATSPRGGFFDNQLLMIDLLSKCLPEGWWLYVKEHPYQFQPVSRGQLSRDTTFYDDITSSPNVRLVPLSFSPFELIDNARAVVTVTGTIGWEALVRGKPVLLFGHAWYRDCEGAFYTPTVASCKAALSKIQAGYRVDHKKVRLFLHALEKVCLRGYIETWYAKVSDLSYEQNISNLARAIQNLYQGASPTQT